MCYVALRSDVRQWLIDFSAFKVRSPSSDLRSVLGASERLEGLFGAEPRRSHTLVRTKLPTRSRITRNKSAGQRYVTHVTRNA